MALQSVFMECFIGMLFLPAPPLLKNDRRLIFLGVSVKHRQKTVICQLYRGGIAQIGINPIDVEAVVGIPGIASVSAEHGAQRSP